MKVKDYVTDKEFRDYADIGITPEDTPEVFFEKLSLALDKEKEKAIKERKANPHLEPMFEPWSFKRLVLLRGDVYNRGLRWTKYLKK